MTQSKSKSKPSENRWHTIIIKINLECRDSLSSWETNFVRSIDSWLTRRPDGIPSEAQQRVIHKLIDKYLPDANINLESDDEDELDDNEDDFNPTEPF